MFQFSILLIIIVFIIVQWFLTWGHQKNVRGREMRTKKEKKFWWRNILMSFFYFDLGHNFYLTYSTTVEQVFH